MRQLTVILTILTMMLFLALPLQAQDELMLDWDPVVNTVIGTVDLHGSAAIADQQWFFVEAALYEPGSSAAQWTPVVTYQFAPVVNGLLGAWATTAFNDGIYQLRLHAVDAANESHTFTLAPIAINNDGATINPNSVQVIDGAGAKAQSAAPAMLENRLPLPVGGHVKYFNEATQAALRAAGMTWVKKQVQFGISDGKELIEAAHAQGYKVMLGALGDKNQLAQDFDGYVAAFAEYVAYLAELGADAIEVWNEPNIDREWTRGRVHGANYARLLQAAYPAIKAANPDTLVVSGAPAPTGFFAGCAAGGCDDNVFMAQMAAAGVADYADCIGVHYNEGILPPSAQGGDPRDTYETRYLILMLRRVAWAFRNADIPMCLTEIGYLSPEGYGPLPPGFTWAANTSVAEQADWIAQAMQIAADFQEMPVELAIVWNIDFDTYDADPQAGYAIIRPDGACPACQQIALLQG